MPIDPLIVHQPRDKRAEERRLRVGILRLGALLGWDAPTITYFAEAVTGRPLSRCGRADLQQVLEAYAAVARLVRAAQARQPGATGDGGTS